MTENENSAMPETRLWNRNFIAIAIANFLLFFSLYLLLPLLPLYLRDTFNADKDTIGFILSGYVITALIIRPFGGFIVDSYPRKTVLLVTFALFSIFFVGYIVAGTVLVFAIIRCLHGFPFGIVTVANSTVAIDVMPPAKRGEGIGYYGVFNSLAMVIGPSVSMYMYEGGIPASYIFMTALISSAVGFGLNCTLRTRPRERVENKEPISLDRFFLTRAIPESLMVIFFSFAYGILVTYISIYGRDEVGIESGSGPFFSLLAVGLIAARIISAPQVRKGMLTRNIGFGMTVAIVGFILFLTLRNSFGFYGAALILGIGYGAMCPSFQTSFINMAPNSRRGTANSTYLTSWDLGVGAGLILGGSVAENLSYFHAYCLALAMALIGIVAYFSFIARHYNSHKLLG